jgi:hypothetical protein
MITDEEYEDAQRTLSSLKNDVKWLKDYFNNGQANEKFKDLTHHINTEYLFAKLELLIDENAIGKVCTGCHEKVGCTCGERMR